MLVPDGVTEIDPPYFRTVSAPSAAELQALAQTISERIGRHLERTGKLVRDEESSYLALESEGEGEDALQDLQGHSIRYRIAVGPHKGRKALMLQSLPPLTGERTGEPVAKVADFSLHAGVAADVHQRQKLERLCRYITRPPVAIERLSLTPQGSIRYSLKTPYRDGTTHVIVEPLDFIARLASLVPSPRVNLTRFRGVFIQGAVNLQGGTAFGTGTITSAVNNTGATIQGGSSGVAGTLTINGSLTQGSGGTIQELISGRSAGQFSQILVNGVVGLGGALDVVTSGFTLHSGEDFTILSASSLTGSFAMLDFNGSNVGSGYNDCLDYIGNNLGIEAVYNGANVTLDVVRDPQAVPEADPASAASGLTLLLGGLLILRGRRTIETRAI